MAHTDFRTALQGANEIEITVTGRTSALSLSYPVWFALDGDKLYLLPVKGSDTDWYKNLRKTPTIRLEARGKMFTTSARLLSDEAQIGKVLEKFHSGVRIFRLFRRHLRVLPHENNLSPLQEQDNLPSLLFDVISGPYATSMMRDVLA